MDNPRTRFHAYCHVQGIPLIGITEESPTDKGFELQFDPSATKKQIDEANKACYKTPEVFGGWQPLPIAALQQFEKAILCDGTIPISSRLALPSLIALIKPLTGYFERQSLQTLWQQAKSDSGAAVWLAAKCSDGKKVSDKIEAAAQQHSIYLV